MRSVRDIRVDTASVKKIVGKGDEIVKSKTSLLQETPAEKNEMNADKTRAPKWYDKLRRKK